MKLKTVLLALLGAAFLWGGEWLQAKTNSMVPPVPWYSFPLFLTEYLGMTASLAAAFISTMPKFGGK